MSEAGASLTHAGDYFFAGTVCGIIGGLDFREPLHAGGVDLGEALLRLPFGLDLAIPQCAFEGDELVFLERSSEGVRVKVNDGAKQNPKLYRAEPSRDVLKDAVVSGFPGLALFVPAGLFRLVLLLLPFHLLPPFLSVALLLGFELLPASVVFGPALLGFFICLGFWRGGQDGEEPE